MPAESRAELVRRHRREYEAAFPDWRDRMPPGTASVEVTFEMTDGNRVTYVMWRKGGPDGEVVEGDTRGGD